MKMMMRKKRKDQSAIKLSSLATSRSKEKTLPSQTCKATKVTGLEICLIVLVEKELIIKGTMLIDMLQLKNQRNTRKISMSLRRSMSIQEKRRDAPSLPHLSTVLIIPLMVSLQLIPRSQHSMQRPAYPCLHAH